MIADLKPYSAMKDSGVEWLGDVPAHWDVRRMKTLFNERNEKGHANEPLLAATQTKGVIRKEQYENRTVLALKDLHLLKMVRIGDFVISLRSFQGGIEYAREQGIISPAYTILFVVNPENHEYLAHLFKSKPYIENLGLFVTGIRQGQNIDYEKLSRSGLPLPSSLEQTAIVRYLDYVGRRVQKFVKAKQKLIKLLEEQKQAIIHRAVTRGLDPDVSLKNSGVEWLGKIPEHWNIQPLKYWVQINKSVLPENTGADFEFEYLDIGSTGMGVLMEKPQRIRFSMAPSRARRIVRDGDTLVSTVRTYLKAVWFADRLDDFLIASTGFAVLSPNSNTAPKYVSYLVQSDSFTNRVTAESVGIAYPAIPESKLAGFKVAIPPLTEQTMIVEHLDKATTNIDAITARTRHEITLLQEYHTRLTADVVTGKVDVRDAAANLPDEGCIPASLRAPDVPETKTDSTVEEFRT